MNTTNDVDFLASLSEEELRELVIIPLLSEMGFEQIRRVHGSLEFGKDVVFIRKDPLDIIEYCCATIKAHKLDGSVSSSRSVREVYYQVSQALKEPFIDPLDGHEVNISRAYVITSFPISQACIRSIRSELGANQHRVNFIDGPRLIDLIKKHLPSLLSVIHDPESRFLNTLYQRLLDGETTLRFGARRSFLLPDIYTGGCIEKTTLEEAKYISFARPRNSEERISPCIELVTNRRIVIIADVGAGKTTLAKKIAIDLIEQRHEFANKLGRPIPILVPLHLLDVQSFSRKSLFIKGISELISSAEGHTDFSIENAERYVILLDGFDELPTHHEDAQERLQELAEQKWSALVVTTRPTRIPYLDRPFEYYRLNAFDVDDIRAFLTKWFSYDAAVCSSVTTRILEDDALLGFCRTPLMLTLYSILAERRPSEKLPIRRSELYSMISQALLGRWDDIRRVRNQFSADEKAFVLERIAFRTHSQGIRIFPRSDLYLEVERFMFSRSDGRQPDTFVSELVYRSSLIHPISGDSFEFVHLSFQEYFTAMYLIRSPIPELLNKRLYDEWWRGVWLFYFGYKRNIEEVRLRAKKTARGRGIVLMQLLTEADYTPLPHQNKIIKLLAQDVLSGADLNESEMNFCCKVGMRLIDALWPHAEKEKGNLNIGNLYRILFSMGTEEAYKRILSSSHLISRMKIANLFWLIETCSVFVDDEYWMRFFSLCCKASARIITETNDAGIGESIKKTRKTVYKRVANLKMEKQAKAEIGKLYDLHKK
jgi:hypothetical protein